MATRLHITIDAAGRISNEMLGTLRGALSRNTPAHVTLSPTELASQLIRIAREQLHHCHVYEGVLPDRTVLLFTRDSPPPNTRWPVALRQSEQLDHSPLIAQHS